MSGEVQAMGRLVDGEDRMSLRVPGLDGETEVAYAVLLPSGLWELHLDGHTRELSRRVAKEALLRALFGGGSQ